MELGTIWFLLIGGLLVLVGVASTCIERLPLTTSVLYLVLGFILGPQILNLIPVNPLEHSKLLEFVAEIVVIVSLFSAGLKLRLPLKHANWRTALRLAFVSMTLTVGAVAVVVHYLFDFSWGLGILLGAIIAPTDPVLASSVQVESPKDQDNLRFSLTGEAGLNDGSAFPFVMLGLILLGLDDRGENWLLNWFLVDVLWAVAAGLLIGTVLGTGASKLITSLRTRNKDAIVLDDFVAMGLIALSYGLALAIHSYGFLAVFAAGLALRRVEREHTASDHEVREKGVEKEPQRIASAALAFNEQLERLGEVGTVLLLGGMVTLSYFSTPYLLFVPILLFLIRPIAVALGLIGEPLTGMQKPLFAWFGIRGIGSIYYLMYAINHGLPEQQAVQLTLITFLTITVSVLIHGTSVTPLMNVYKKVGGARGRSLKAKAPASKPA